MINIKSTGSHSHWSRYRCYFFFSFRSGPIVLKASVISNYTLCLSITTKEGVQHHSMKWWTHCQHIIALKKFMSKTNYMSWTTIILFVVINRSILIIPIYRFTQVFHLESAIIFNRIWVMPALPHLQTHLINIMIKIIVINNWQSWEHQKSCINVCIAYYIRSSCLFCSQTH